MEKSHTFYHPLKKKCVIRIFHGNNAKGVKTEISKNILQIAISDTTSLQKAGFILC